MEDDYYIAYTDTYGYRYDPETGTYIKDDPPPAAGRSAPDPAAVAHGAAAVRPEPARDPGMAAPAATKPATANSGLFAAGLVAVPGLATYTVRRSRQR